jgi:predicted ATPase/DNA-binding winged helix-turn-helix (wHTH) protein
MTTAMDQPRAGLSFGPFNLLVGERLLTRDGARVELGARAFDLLIVLISTPNEVVSKKDLMARVWPDVRVEEGSLRFHMNGLRKALGDGVNGARYITTLAGRGYCFVAPVSQAVAPASTPRIEPAKAPAHFPHANLPNRLSRMIGRDADIRALSAQLTESRFVTVVGTGGVGKTTVAVAVAHHLGESFGGATLFVDLGMLGNPELVAAAMASMLGLRVGAEDARPNLIAHLRDKRILLVLDTCEHLIEAVAQLAAGIIEAAPEVHILATSREALRIDGEHVYRLDALACPADDQAVTAAALGEFPAMQLFVERAAASGAHLDIGDDEAPLVATICRKLDGVALAIELAARRVDTYGLQQIAALLDQHLALPWSGSRTAPARQRTLQATLDWSFGLLSEPERLVLRRLAVFVGHFTLDAALEVVAAPPLDRSTVLGAIDSLVAKSMVVTRPIGAMVRYRLLDTTRAYALDIALDAAEATDLAVRHANYYRRWLGQSGTEWATLKTGTERAPHFAGLNNARAALEWSFGDGGDAAAGVALAAAAAPVFLAMSLMPECHRWSERALLWLDEGRRGGAEEMQLQASLGLSLMYISGHSEAASTALHRSVDIAKARGDHLSEVSLLGPLFFYYLRLGEFKVCLEHARRSAEIAGALAIPSAAALAHTLLGISLTLKGNLGEAEAELDAALEAGKGSADGRTIYFGFDHYSWVRVARITLLCLQGHPERSRVAISEAFRDVGMMHHPVALAIVINSSAALLWIGDLDAAEQHLDWFIARAESDSFAPYLHLGRAFKGELAICRGDIKAGVELLQGQLEKLRATRYGLFTMRLQAVLARGLGASGRWAEALALVEETGRLIEEKGYTSYLPELLRLKGSILLAMPKALAADAERCFQDSLELSRAQGARAWELRAATELAAHWATKGRATEARALLQPALGHFTEGVETPDLKAARSLMAKLGRRGRSA